MEQLADQFHFEKLRSWAAGQSYLMSDERVLRDDFVAKMRYGSKDALKSIQELFYLSLEQKVLLSMLQYVSFK